MKRKPKGWKNESARHSLASRGVRTTRQEQLIHRPHDYDFDYDYDHDYDYDFKEEWEREQRKAQGDPIVLDISGRGSFDGDLRISLEGVEELAPLLKSRGVRMQALSAFNSTSGTQKIEGRIEGVDVDLKITHPGEDLYHVEGDMYYHIDRTFTRKELKGFYGKVKRLM